jgi:hypothetical protein
MGGDSISDDIDEPITVAVVLEEIGFAVSTGHYVEQPVDDIKPDPIWHAGASINSDARPKFADLLAV